MYGRDCKVNRVARDRAGHRLFADEEIGETTNPS